MSERGQGLETLVQSYVQLQLREFILAKGRPVKVGELGRELGSQLGVSPRLLRRALQEASDLVPVDRFWDLVWHQDEVERSIDGAVRTMLQEHGLPLQLSVVVQEIARLRRRAYEVAWDITQRVLLQRTDQYVFLQQEGGDPFILLRRWLLYHETHRESEEGRVREVRLRNFLQEEDRLEAGLAALRWPRTEKGMSPVELALAAIERAEGPVDHRYLAFAVWQRQMETFDPVEFFVGLWRSPKTHLLPGPVWVSARLYQHLQREVEALSARLEQETPDRRVDVSIEEALATPVEARARITITEEDLLQVYQLLAEAQEGLSVLELTIEALEFFPGDEEYIPGVQSLQSAMVEDPRFVQVGVGRWYLSSQLPVALHAVPIVLRASGILVYTLIGEAVDAELTDAGLDGDLDLEVHAPDLEDVDEEHEVGELGSGVTLARRVRYVTMPRHYESGTLKVRKIDHGVFSRELTSITPVRLNLGERTYHVWYNPATSLVAGLESFYRENLPPAGGVFFVELQDGGKPGEGPLTLRVTIDERPDPFLFVPIERMAVLEERQRMWEVDPQISVLQIIQRLMEDHPQGVTFRRLFTEVNTVRRVTKRMVASNLSSYPCFNQLPNSSLWVYDPQKANRPRLPAKKRFLMKAAEG